MFLAAPAERLANLDQRARGHEMGTVDRVLSEDWDGAMWCAELAHRYRYAAREYASILRALDGHRWQTSVARSAWRRTW